MISIPFDMEGSILGTLSELGEQDNAEWRLWGYYNNTAPSGSIPYSPLPGGPNQVFEKGRSYWLIVRSGGIRLNTGPTVGTTTATIGEYGVVLEPGWNMIGSPFDFEIAWNSLAVDGMVLDEAVAEGLVEPPVRWVPGYGYRAGPTILEPFEGYWIRNVSDPPGDVTLEVPPLEYVPETTVQRVDGMGQDQGWAIGITASSGGIRDAYNVAGVRSGASDERDPFDRTDPPLYPGEGLTIYFPQSAAGGRPERFTVDIRGDENQDGGHAWAFDVAKNFSDREGSSAVEIEFDIPGDLAADTRIALADRVLERLVDLRNERVYGFTQGKRTYVAAGEDARFVLLVGSDAFVESFENRMPGPPTATALHPNYPNPFNPTTVISYELSKRSRVRIAVYDVTGALVKVVEDRERPRGRYEVGWTGINSAGEPVASGVYFCRFSTEGFVQTRKMILLK
jgi:hypothetical protein